MKILRPIDFQETSLADGFRRSNDDAMLRLPLGGHKGPIGDQKGSAHTSGRAPHEFLRLHRQFLVFCSEPGQQN